MHFVPEFLSGPCMNPIPSLALLRVMVSSYSPGAILDRHLLSSLISRSERFLFMVAVDLGLLFACGQELVQGFFSTIRMPGDLFAILETHYIMELAGANSTIEKSLLAYLDSCSHLIALGLVWVVHVLCRLDLC